MFSLLTQTAKDLFFSCAGYHPLDNVIQKLQGLITSYEPELVVLRTERYRHYLSIIHGHSVELCFLLTHACTCREHRSLDQQLREQQEREFLMSLRADQEKVSVPAVWLV